MVASSGEIKLVIEGLDERFKFSEKCKRLPQHFERNEYHLRGWCFFC